MMGIIFVVAGWLKSAAVRLAALPWYVLVMGGLAASLGWSLHSRSEWINVAAARDRDLVAIQLAQNQADDVAHELARRVAAAHAVSSKETLDANHEAHAAAGGAADALRLRVAELERAAGSGAMSGHGTAAPGVDAQIDLRLPLADELALRNACEAQRIDRNSLIDWEAARVAIDAPLSAKE